MPAEPSRPAAPRVSVDDIWRLLAASKLLAAERLVSLRAAFDKAPPTADAVDAKRLAKWLIAQGAITRYHAQALLAGQPGPFRFGDYLVLEPLEGAVAPGLFRGRSITRNQSALLYFATGKELKRPDAVGRLRDTLGQWRSAAGPGLIVADDLIDDGPYKLFALPEFSGEALSERLRILRVLPADRASHFVAQVSTSIVGLHRAGLAHGAIRTASIVIAPSGQAQLLGFPLSRDPLVSAGVIAAPPAATPYEAPELRIASSSATAQSDVYALGCVLYELLTGVLTATGTPLVAADRINPATPSELASLVTRCLAQNPVERPANAAELANLLATWTGESSSPAAIPVPHDAPRIAIQTSAAPPLIATVAPPPRRNRTGPVAIAAALAIIGITLAGLWGAGYFTDPSTDAPTQTVAVGNPPTSGSTPDVPDAPKPPADRAQGYGEPLWARPFPAAPWKLAYVPSGAQMIVALRPRAILASADGEKLAALPGPSSEWLTKTIPALTGFEATEIEHLTLALIEEPNGSLPVVALVRLSKPLDADAFAQLHAAQPGDPPPGFAARACGDRLLLRPNVIDAPLVCLPAANQDLLAEIATSRGATPNLRPQLESLLPYTAADADLAVLAAPSFLYEALPQHCDDSAKPVWPLLETWLGRDSRGVLASVSFQDQLFIEVRVVGGDLAKPRQMADAWESHLAAAPHAMRDYLQTRALIEYSRPVLLQFGQMLQVLAAYARLGEEHGQLVVRCVLPEGAAHNLYLASYLAAREPPLGQQVVVAAPPTPAGKTPLAELLKRSTSLSFPNNSLETALQLLADDLGFKVRIEGNDLKIDGITRNQAIRDLNEQNRPAEEILRTILKKANPAGKLVYLPQRDPATGEEVLVITTRAAAGQRGETLPPELSQP